MANTVYDPKRIEVKWQQFWEENDLFQDDVHQKTDKEKLYLLFAFAYPSGAGLHVGHVESKTALDILARYHRMNGKQVFFPVGWDAFGLPAENYAIKTGVHPAITTKNAIDTFRRQIKRIGISYDWKNELATNHPEYYRWTQWIFLQLYNKGLAYRKGGMVNWCPSCQTVLANEQVVNGHCERCGSDVIQKEMEQWFFKITEYKDELISGLDEVDWPKATKQQQLNWIGKKAGINITYQVEGTKDTIVCFSTRPDTNFGATFIVLAPEHSFAQQFLKHDAPKHPNEVREYISNSKKKTELERQSEGRTKTGVFTGYYGINQLNGERLPIWISDFVLAGFGTGAVVGVPGHDLRDYQFATAMGIPVKRVVVGPDEDTSEITDEKQIFEDEGTAINSGFLDGLSTREAIEKVMEYMESKGFGQKVVTYKLRDWLISRQRYWGAPIPVVYDPEGKPHPVKEEHLPWLLPTDVEFKPTGESPLHYSKEFQERVEKLYGKDWRPEYDTMDTFVDSSWYFLRYIDSRDKKVFASAEQIKKWLPVDLYMIGPEHIVLHLLYARFFTKFLRDEGYLSFNEPFKKMRHQGMIMGPDGQKMSKSKGNVINPDEVVEKYGADTLRVYEMFMGPIEADKPWSTSSVVGVYRFLSRVHQLATNSLELSSSSSSITLQRKLHQTIKKVTQDIPALKFNTSIAAMMEFVNVWESEQKQGKSLAVDELTAFVKVLCPFAPFLSEELYALIEKEVKPSAHSIHLANWPVFDEKLLVEDTLEVVVQVNGKTRGQLSVKIEHLAQQEHVEQLVKEQADLAKWLVGKQIRKVIYVSGKLINFVVS